MVQTDVHRYYSNVVMLFLKRDDHFTSNGEDLKIGVHHDHPSQREHSEPMQTSQAVSRGRFGTNDFAAVRDRIEGC